MRVLLALLLLANLGFFALSQGWLAPFAALPAGHEREPQRLAAQVEADSVRVLDARFVGAPEARAPVASASAIPASAAPVCLQAGPFSGTEIGAAEAALASLALPAASWQRLRLASDGTEQFALRIDAADAGLRERLNRLPPPWPGGAFRPCP